MDDTVSVSVSDAGAGTAATLTYTLTVENAKDEPEDPFIIAGITLSDAFPSLIRTADAAREGDMYDYFDDPDLKIGSAALKEERVFTTTSSGADKVVSLSIRDDGILTLAPWERNGNGDDSAQCLRYLEYKRNERRPNRNVRRIVSSGFSSLPTWGRTGGGRRDGRRHPTSGEDSAMATTSVAPSLRRAT